MATRVLDECSPNAAIQATLETSSPSSPLVVRLRPHQPSAYYAAQQHSVILTVDGIQAIVDLLRRNGQWDEK